MSAGTGQPNVNGQALGSLRIPLPPLAEQKRIVAKVDELMGLCDRWEAQEAERQKRHVSLAQAALARFEQEPTPANLTYLFHPSYDITPADLRKTILSLAVRGKLVPQEHSSNRRASFVPRSLDDTSRGNAFDHGSVPFDIPSHWRWVRLNEVAACRLGKMLDQNKNKGTPYPYLRNTNVHWFRLDLTSIKTMLLEEDEVKEFALANGDVLICEGGHGIGRAAVWPGHTSTIVFQKALHRIRPSNLLNPHFLTYCLKVLETLGRLKQFFTGAGIPHLTGQSLAKVPFPLPPLAEQKRIVAKVEQLMALVDQLEAQLAESRTKGEKLLNALVAELSDSPTSSETPSL
jgi:type I restriction enzyme S subunit